MRCRERALGAGDLCSVLPEAVKRVLYVLEVVKGARREACGVRYRCWM